MSSDPEAALDKRVALARQYIGVGDWENAKRNLELAQEVDPNNAEVFEAFALVYQSTGEFEMAENQFRAALKAEPSLSRARNNFAAFLYSQGRYIEAEREFYRVTEDTLCSGRPWPSSTWGSVGCSWRTTGRRSGLYPCPVDGSAQSGGASGDGFLRLEAGDTNEAARYHGVYRTVSPQQSPRGLLLGLEIADQTGDQDALGSYELALRNLYRILPSTGSGWSVRVDNEYSV